MMRLKSKLLSLNASKVTKVKVYSPRNTEELRIPFKSDKTAKVVGKLASIAPPPQQLKDDPSSDENGRGPADHPLVSGVLVQNDFKLSLMAPEDLREYAGLSTTTMTCKQHLRLSAAGVDLIKWALEGTFGSIDELPEMRNAAAKVQNGDQGSEEEQEEADEEVSRVVAAYLVMGCVTVRYRTSGDVELEWEANLLNDGIADSVMGVLLSVESSPAAVKRSSAKHDHDHEADRLPAPGEVNPHARPSPEERLERFLWFLEAQFGADNVEPVATPRPPPAAAAQDGSDAMDTNDDGAREARELERLHKLGIPVPGVSIRVDKMRATVWLEDLEVECSNKIFADRVRAVVERAAEVTAPLWA